MKIRRLAVLALLLGAVLMSSACSVKKHEDDGSHSAKEGDVGSLPPGVYLTKAKNFLIKESAFPSHSGLGEVDYQIVTASLESISNQITLQVHYEMPSMIDMPAAPAVIKASGEGRFSVQYDLSMNGAWEVELDLVQNGQVVDNLIQSFQVEN